MKRPDGLEIDRVAPNILNSFQRYSKFMNPIRPPETLISNHSIADGHYPDAIFLAALPMVMGDGKVGKAVMQVDQGGRQEL